MSGYAEYSKNNLDNQNIIDLPLIIATDYSLAGLGYIVEDYDDSKVDLVQWPKYIGKRKLEKGTGYSTVSEGTFRTWWKDDVSHAENHTVNSGCYKVSMYHKNRFITREMNYHPEGGQIIFPKEKKPFIVFLGTLGDDIYYNPDISVISGTKRSINNKFFAFYFDGSKGLHINTGVWHQPPIPVSRDDSGLEFFDKQGSVHGCVLYDSLSEHNCWLGVNIPDYLTRLSHITSNSS